MAAMVALRSRLGRRTLTHFVTAAVCLTDSGAHAVLWRSCSQYKQATSNEDLPVFVGRNKRKSQKQLRELR
ncbi:small ribosomal subunit protein bS18m-like isoform X4 [Lagenorhynchus albirostris]|uniref:small ribosomal subunit protein bS18m-like isoform X4 n=1 Tax=Lagenorhynchus albirostris TaxID=27610 RepID=UPI0028EFFDEB|nr:small ribosomal subunit protein bS18m-like isoform X4 [Lagenorhynchus albirostris]